MTSPGTMRPRFVICDGDPGQERESLPVGGVAEQNVSARSRGSRWSAHSEARTNDLDAGEDRDTLSSSLADREMGSRHGIELLSGEGARAKAVRGTPSVISEHGSGHGSGDIMVDGVFPRDGEVAAARCIEVDPRAEGDTNYGGAGRSIMIDGGLSAHALLQAASAKAWSPSSRRVW